MPLESLGDFEALWESQRQVTAQRIVDNGWGIDDSNVLIGPGGLRVDLNDCPQDWDPTTGISQGEVNLEIASDIKSLSNIETFTAGMAAYLDQVNDTGGIDDLEVLHRQSDIYYSAFSPDIDRPLEQPNVPDPEPFLLLTWGIDATGAQVALEDHCIPQLAVSSQPSLTNPDDDPWTFSLTGSYATEAAIWVDMAVEHSRTLGRSVTVGGVAMDNRVGAGFVEPFTQLASTQPEIAEIVIVEHSQESGFAAAETTEALESKPDVWLTMTAGNPCLSVLETVAQNAHQPSLIIQPSFCRNRVYYADASAIPDQWFSVQTGFPESEAFPDVYDEWVRGHLADVDPAAYQAAAAGFGRHAWLAVEILRTASLLPDGVTRPNVLLAMWSLQTTPPWQPGYTGIVNGPADPFLFETHQIDRYDSATDTWTHTQTISVEGQTPTPTH